jgi:DNA-binding transcriptional MerR regulator
MENSLPEIPAKRYFTIGEVSELCGVKPYVLRYWEQEFTQLRPMKRRGNRRYYQHHEVLLIRRIRDLLYEQGFTISGARNRLADQEHLPEVEEMFHDISLGQDPLADDGHDAPGPRAAGSADQASRLNGAGHVGQPAAAIAGTVASTEHLAQLVGAAALTGPTLRDELLSIRRLLELDF